jgi:ribonuclease HI
MVTQARSPHYLLFSDASGPKRGVPRWRFVLQLVGCDDQLAAGDLEPGATSSRLELLAVVRGLEAIDQPSRVTLVTRSRYVARGIRRGLTHWRDRCWGRERLGKLEPIRDRDLWQRVDRALEFHDVQCAGWLGQCGGESWGAAASPSVSATASEPALVIVPRARPRGALRNPRETGFTRMIGRLRAGILAPISNILRPAFTRAA